MVDWQPFLTELNHVLLTSKVSSHVSDPIRKSGWLGFPPATESQIFALEQKLNRALPPSYRQFLLITNGWTLLSLGIGRLWAVEDIAWFSERNSDVIEALEAIDLDYVGLLRVGLEVSEFTDGEGFLLNPDVVDDDGEWQAVRLFDTDPPESYANFWDLMQVEFQRLKVSMAIAPGHFGRTVSIPAHEANREKVNATIALIEERISLMEKGLRRVPKDQKIRLEQSISLVKNILVSLMEIKANETEPDTFSQRKAELLESWTQPAFQAANYPIRFILDYCASILE